MTLDTRVAPDGSPVPVYLALPVEPEFTSVLGDLPAGASVLDLGCGVGRLANVLAAGGHRLTGVDESAAMLRNLDPVVTSVRSRIEDLELDARFDAVVLASHLVNLPDPTVRRSLLDSAARHLDRSGCLYVEHYDPDPAALTERESAVGPVRVAFELLERDGRRFRARVTYRLDDRLWQQTFAAVVLDESELGRELARSGLRVARRLTRTWLVATPGETREG